jgi:hypothetical protein
VSDDADSVQMLQRSTQVGEYYRMLPPHAWAKNVTLPANYMDIVIYDEEMDKHTHITFEQALYACCVDDAANGGAQALNICHRFFGGDETFSRNLIIAAYGVNDLAALIVAHTVTGNGGTGPAHADARTAIQEFVTAPGGAGANAANYFTKAGLANCVRKGVWLPICITVARPFIEHLAMSCVMTVSGRDTGATLFGPADSAPPPATALATALATDPH